MWINKLYQPQYSHRLKRNILILVVVIFFFLMTVITRMYIISSLGTSSPLAIPGKDDRYFHLMVLPTGEGEYKLDHPEMQDFSRGQSRIIDNLLQKKLCYIGAGDGERNSVSLFFERTRDWQGVLIEGDQRKHEASVAKNRNAQSWNFMIKMHEKFIKNHTSDILPGQLFQLINRTSIDLLNVNINGLEYDFIRNIDFDKYHIKVITIELENGVSKERYMKLTNLLTALGYRVAHQLINTLVNKKDVIYIRD